MECVVEANKGKRGQIALVVDNFDLHAKVSFAVLEEKMHGSKTTHSRVGSQLDHLHSKLVCDLCDFFIMFDILAVVFYGVYAANRTVMPLQMCLNLVLRVVIGQFLQYHCKVRGHLAEF